MKRLSFLFFLALTSQAYGSLGGGTAAATGRAGWSLDGGSRLGRGAGLSWDRFSDASPSNTGYEDFSGTWPGPGYDGGFEAGAGFNSEGSGAAGPNVFAGGVGATGGFSSGSNAASGSLSYDGPAGGNRAISVLGRRFGGAGGLESGIGTGGLVTGVGSSNVPGSYGDSAGIGSTAGTFGGRVGAGSFTGNGLGSGAVGSPLEPRGGLGRNTVGLSNADKLAQRRRRGRIAGAVVGTALTGLLLGGLIGGLRRLRQDGRLRHHGTISGFGSTSYERYGDGYGYRSRQRSGMFYGGYYRGCKTCLRQRRPCFGVGCY